MSAGFPRTWLLRGQKAGDNNQLIALADALAWPYEAHDLFYRSWELLSNQLLRVTLAGIDRERSSPLAPPWPDLILTAGRRNEPVARWIRKQTGGKCKLVHIGRPWAPLDRFDLIITTPQYFVPRRNNVLHNSLPLHRLTPDRLIDAGSKLQPRLGGLRRPYTAVLVGGNSGAFRFTRRKGERFGRLVDGLACFSGGSVLMCSSPRTPNGFFDEALAGVKLPHFAWRWQADHTEDNPYLGILALADQFVITGDSISMLAEAASTSMPIYIFDPGDNVWWWWLLPHNWHHRVISQRLSPWLAPRRMRRDVGRIQQALVMQGRAVFLGQGWIDPTRRPVLEPSRDLERAVTRVRALFNL